MINLYQPKRGRKPNNTLYHLVVSLAKQGLSYNEIAKLLKMKKSQNVYYYMKKYRQEKLSTVDKTI
jgi:phosphoribosyl-ATP pyrophosphohydrolase